MGTGGRAFGDEVMVVNFGPVRLLPVGASPACATVADPRPSSIEFYAEHRAVLQWFFQRHTLAAKPAHVSQAVYLRNSEY